MRVVLLCAVLLTWCCTSAFAQNPQAFGPFIYLPDKPKILTLLSQIGDDGRDALQFKKALREHPEIEIIQLISPGGNVRTALLIAEDIFDKGLSTYIPPEGSCASACAFLFFAGSTRLADGKLGVHQLDASDGKLTGADAQLGLSDVISTIVKFGVSGEVMSIMLKTPPADMYFFTHEEIEKYGLNRTASTSLPNVSPVSPGKGAIIPQDKLVETSQIAAKLIVSSGELSAPAALQAVKEIYDDNIDYYGRKTSKSELLDDKRKYMERWPHRTYIVDDNSLVSRCAETICIVAGFYQYTLNSPVRQKETKGLAAFVYGMEIRNQKQSIFIENGTIVRAKTYAKLSANQTVEQWLASLK
ncbi:hypothetical protein AB4Y96_09065 [Phyllobacterium sp. TAF24]|uniref:hypothetical protein n=1 Tax=Phyllobacterium sp. TAF24 TaxID=3233068 RepID=UPI003F9DD057